MDHGDFIQARALINHGVHAKIQVALIAQLSDPVVDTLPQYPLKSLRQLLTQRLELGISGLQIMCMKRKAEEEKAERNQAERGRSWACHTLVELLSFGELYPLLVCAVNQVQH